MTVVRLLLLTMLIVAGTCPPAQAELIRNFKVHLQVDREAVLDVVEIIDMDFEGSKRHGIERKIPTMRSGHSNEPGLEINVLEVSDQNGNPYNKRIFNQGRTINIRIGDADRRVSGPHTYKIHYQVKNAIRAFDGEPEIYWNATGNDWPYPIEKSEVLLYAPEKVSLDEMRATAYQGRSGEKEPVSIEQKKDHFVYTTSVLNPGEGLTVVARLPKGFIDESKLPSPDIANDIAKTDTSQSQRKPRSGWTLLPLVLIALIPFTVFNKLHRKWQDTGRDEAEIGPVSVEWNPPQNITPAEAGTLIDEFCGLNEISATIVDLAVRGYLRIAEVTMPNLIGSSKEYVLEKLDPPGGELQYFEQSLLAELFDHKSSVRTTDLENNFYKHIPYIRGSIYSHLTQKQYFKDDPDSVRKTYYNAGGALLLCSFIAVFWLILLGALIVAVENSATRGFAAIFLLSLSAGAFISGLVVLGFAPAMPARTRKGVLETRKCLSFKRYVRLAEKERIEKLCREDPTIFERLLPYAMALGVEKYWAKVFEGLLSEPPEWFVGYGDYTHLSTIGFVDSLNSCMTDVSRSMTSTPSSGGSSSGFSGGGSSGGGFGGGGGGSW